MARVGEFFTFFLLSVLAAFYIHTLISANYFAHILNHAPGPCRVIEANGAEDVEVLPNGLAFVSSGLRYVIANSLDPVVARRKGKLMTLSLPHKENTLLELPLNSFNASDFNPHGLSLYTDPNTGLVSVFVVNHKSDGSQAIEIFDFATKTTSLTHRRSVVDPKINSPNDLLAVGRESFYVTNDHYFHYDRPLLRMLEVFLLSFFLRSDVIYFDGSEAFVAASGFKGPNGINMDKDGRYVFVSTGHEKGINIYERQSDSTLKLVQEIYLGTYIDNINVNLETGELWLGGVPKPMDVVAHVKNVSLPVPAQVIAIRLNEHDPSGAVPFPDYDAREVYMNDGSELKTSTSAAFFKGSLLVGTIYDNLLVCDVKAY